MRLDPQTVEVVFAICNSETGDVHVEGIVESARFDKPALADHAEQIAALLLELPDEFMVSKGGGWSFLNACFDRHGEQWTGFHRTMDRLFMLGMGIGMVECQLPREMWDALPGCMPYYVVKDPPRTAADDGERRSTGDAGAPEGAPF